MFWSRSLSGRGYGYVAVSRFSSRLGCHLYGRIRRTDFLPVGEDRDDEVLEREYDSVDSSDDEDRGMQYNFVLSDSDEEPHAEQDERPEVQEAGGGPYEVDLLLDAVLDAQAVADSGDALAPAASPSPATTPEGGGTYAGDVLTSPGGGGGSSSVVRRLDFESVPGGGACGGMYERDLLVDVEADVGGGHGIAVVSPEPEPGGIERRLDVDALIGGEDLQCGMYAADRRCEHEGGDVTPRSQYHPSLAQHEPPRGGYSPEPVASGAERCLDFHGPSGGEPPHWGTYAVDLQCEDEGGDVTPRSQYQPSLAQHESPRGVDEFVVSPSVSARVEAQGCDTSDEEPPDGLGGQYTWDWLDDAEAFVVGGDLQ